MKVSEIIWSWQHCFLWQGGFCNQQMRGKVQDQICKHLLIIQQNQIIKIHIQTFMKLSKVVWPRSSSSSTSLPWLIMKTRRTLLWGPRTCTLHMHKRKQSTFEQLCKTFGEDELSTEEKEFRCLRLEQRNTAWSSAQMSKRYQWRNSKILYCSINLLNYLQNRFCYFSSNFNLWERDWVVFHSWPEVCRAAAHNSRGRTSSYSGLRTWSAGTVLNLPTESRDDERNMNTSLSALLGGILLLCHFNLFNDINTL